MHLIKLFFIVLASFYHHILSRNTFNTSVIPITKDAKTSLHKVSLSLGEPLSHGEQYYLIDLDAPFTWRDCVLRSPRGVAACWLEEGCRFPLSCDNTLCKEAHSYSNPICPSLNITAKYGCKICAVTPFNPISKSCKISQLTTDLVYLYETNGVRGVAAFSWSALAFPRQMNVLPLENKFALCLPSSSSGPGVAFLGDGPFLSIVVPYTTLRSDIHKELTTSFSKAAIFIPQVNAVLLPFSPMFKNLMLLFYNSMKYMGNGVSCLALMDGGSGVKDSIVIGTYQMENNFLFLSIRRIQIAGFTLPCCCLKEHHAAALTSLKYQND
ncbi:aspartic peptidase A1 family protein [Tanacetum coccineum]|uniref:Aspartic peptidase A1 family protein n=1 Tax=Tanacetum coccineum TaxID=301880 RepID=A0ABQ5DL66_9ASTR